jgi:hypothetical protein
VSKQNDLIWSELLDHLKAWGTGLRELEDGLEVLVDGGARTLRLRFGAAEWATFVRSTADAPEASEGEPSAGEGSTPNFVWDELFEVAAAASEIGIVAGELVGFDPPPNPSARRGTWSP